MTKYRVNIAVRSLEIYEVDADDAESAQAQWGDGELIHTDDEALDSEVLSVKEV